MVVPGLLLEPCPSSSISNMPDNIFMYVKMMCGCPITTGIPNSYWAQNDFVVSADVIYKNGAIILRNLTLMPETSEVTRSLFHAAVADFADIRQVNFTARQKSTGNTGYLSVDYPG